MNRSTTKEPRDFGQLARHIARSATNLLATSIIIVAAFVFGRQTIAWWRAGRDPQESTAARQITAVGAMGNESLLHRMEFGDMPLSFQRISLAGNRRDAFTALRGRCREVAARGGIPLNPAGKWETRMLATLEDFEPVEQQPGRWQLFEMDGPVLLVAAVGRPSGGKTGTLPENNGSSQGYGGRGGGWLGSSAASPQDDGALGAHRSSLAARPQPPRNSVINQGNDRMPGRRVVSWGLGLPAGSPAAENAAGWTLLVCDATTVAGREENLIEAPPLPPSSQRTLSLAVAEGGRIVGFQRSGSAVASQEFFDDWSAQAGWPLDARWQHVGRARHARFGDPRLGWIDVQLLSDAAQSHRGLIVMTPPDTTAEH
jgi:hypothetical protein